MSKTTDPIVIIEAARTPIGALFGKLCSISAPQLGAAAIRGTLGLIPDFDRSLITEVLMGCTLSAGLGQAPARQSSHLAGLPDHVGATTINKVCGSSLQAIYYASALLSFNSQAIYVAGGMESMSQTPFLQSKYKDGKEIKCNPDSTKDHLYLDGLEDATTHQRMGTLAENSAQSHNIARTEQDLYAQRSLKRAQAAQKKEHFLREITSIVLQHKDNTSLKKEEIIEHDEIPQKARLDKIPALSPIFSPTGTITAASTSGIADGAAALLLMRASRAEALGLQPRARIIAQASHALAPERFAEAPIQSIKNLLETAQWSPEQVDLYEINEAFALVPILAMKALPIPSEKINIFGGSCALGHPLGASGARIVVTLLNALEQTQTKRGIASICIGGGEALSLAIERF